jgi:L-alanine-DL-glutamate epimerase-like enolase superfamily enzyme
LRIVQPDLIYFGGLVRSLRVAAMAREAGIDTVPHISGSGLGSLYMAHFASVVPNTTDYQEYKGDPDVVPYEVTGEGRRFQAVDGRLEVPTTPGFGITFDPDFLSGLEPLPA